MCHLSDANILVGSAVASIPFGLIRAYFGIYLNIKMVGREILQSPFEIFQLFTLVVKGSVVTVSSRLVDSINLTGLAYISVALMLTSKLRI